MSAEERWRAAGAAVAGQPECASQRLDAARLGLLQGRGAEVVALLDGVLGAEGLGGEGWLLWARGHKLAGTGTLARRRLEAASGRQVLGAAAVLARLLIEEGRAGAPD